MEVSRGDAMTTKDDLQRPLTVLAPYGALSASGRRRTVPRRGRVFVEGSPPEGFAFVVSGRVKLVCSQPSGRETILDFVEDGGLICANAVFAGCAHCCTAVATTDTEIVEVSRATVEQACGAAPPVVQALLAATTERGMTLCRRVGEVAGGKVGRKIALVLLRLSEGTEAVGGERRLPATLTRQDIAELCGTSVETAIRLVRDLERQGLVRQEGRRLVLPEPARLRRWAEQA